MEKCEKLIGHTFGGRYRIVNVIGIGGMSVVYGAYDLKSGDAVALKLLDDSSCVGEHAKSEARRRFINEAKVMSSLSHPGIVNIRENSKENEPLYFVMEYVEANTLKRKIEECGALTFEETLYFSKQILYALIHTHENGIIHCDVKPQNVMLLSDGSTKLTDFGIARFIDSEDNTESDTAVGTVYYISPEQASGKRIDGRSDLYSLGVMMYEMATGRLPFSAEDTSTVSRMHIEESPMRPRVLDPEIPSGLEQIILHAMEKTPFMRFEDAREMLDAIERLDHEPDTVFEFNRQLEDETAAVAENAERGVHGWVFALAGAALAFLCVLIITIIAVSTVKGSSGRAEITVPDLKGIVWYGGNLDSELYDVKINYVVDASLPENTIISQSVKAGDTKNVSSENPLEITLNVSRKNNELIMGDYTRMKAEDAVKKLESLGYRVRTEYTQSSDVPKGYVVSSDPGSGALARIGQTVTITVSK